MKFSVKINQLTESNNHSFFEEALENEYNKLAHTNVTKMQIASED